MDSSDMRAAESRAKSRMSFYWRKVNWIKLNFWEKLSVTRSSIVDVVKQFVVDHGWILTLKRYIVVI